MWCRHQAINLWYLAAVPAFDADPQQGSNPLQILENGSLERRLVFAIIFLSQGLGTKVSAQRQGYMGANCLAINPA